MDFVQGLGDTSRTVEFAVDDIGRLEVRNGRARITFVTYRDNSGLILPAVSLVWSVDAYRAIQTKREVMNEIILGRFVCDPEFIATGLQ